jgi:hypothetical protein
MGEGHDDASQNGVTQTVGMTLPRNLPTP